MLSAIRSSDSEGFAWSWYSARYRPPSSISSAWVPRSTMEPASTNSISSACISELSRCETMIVAVRSVSLRSAVRMRRSVPASIAAVESSKAMTAGLTMMLRAIESRCRCPPDSDTPRSPTNVRYSSGRPSTQSWS